MYFPIKIENNKWSVFNIKLSVNLDKFSLNCVWILITIVCLHTHMHTKLYLQNCTIFIKTVKIVRLQIKIMAVICELWNFFKVTWVSR